MKPYAYSSELKANAINADYDMAELVLSGKMKNSIKFITMPVRHYKTKRASVRKKEFTASDGALISYYEFTPLQEKEKYPAMIYCHGGGFMFPIQKPMMENSSLYAENCGVKVFLVEYRYAPDADCQRIQEDCQDMLRYVYRNADELGIDREKILLYGDSAGGCLAACTAIRNRDADGYPLKGQMLIYPVCDNESARYASIEQYKKAVWSKRANESMWRLFFHKGVKEIANVVPMKNDMNNLPQAYVEVLQMDVLRDEGIAYANKMKAADVNVECRLVNGAFHGYDAQLKSPLVKRSFDHRYQVIRRMLEN